jgi:dihydroxyacetone kinase
MTGDKQHFLLAALIGGFGRVAARDSLREAEVLWRRGGGSGHALPWQRISMNL